MNALLLTITLALGQPPDVPAPVSTTLDGVWKVVAMEVDGRPATVNEKEASLAIRNSTLTLPGAAAMHGTLRLDIGPRGTMRVYPAAVGTGNRRDPTANNTSPNPAAGGPTNAPTGTSGTGVPGAATGVYVRTADYLIMSIGDPSAATATGTGAGPTSGVPATSPPDSNPNSPTTGTVATVGQPPVTIVLHRGSGNDAPPSTASTPPPAAVSQPVGVPPANQVVAPRRLSEVVGQDVVVNDGTTVGRIDDMVLASDGSSFAISSLNGVATPIPFGALSFSPNGRLTPLGLTGDQFRGLPTIVNGNLNVLFDRNTINRLETAFGPFSGSRNLSQINQTGSGTITSPNTGLPVNPSGAGTNPNRPNNTNPNATNPNQPNTTNPNAPNPNNPNNPNANPPGTGQPKSGAQPNSGGSVPPKGGGGTPGVPKPKAPGKG